MRTENKLANEELARLRSTVEEMRAQKIAAAVGKRVVDADLHALELERDVIGRALGAATKQLFDKQMVASAEANTTPKPRTATPVKKARPTGKALSTPRGPGSVTPRIQQTGGAGRRSGTGVNASGGRR